MSETLAAENVPDLSGVEYLEVGLRIPDGLDFDQWNSVGNTLCAMHERCGFWIGDWYNYGENRYGEMAAQATAIADQATAAGWGIAPGTVQRYAYLAKAFELGRRLPNLGVSYYQAVWGVKDKKKQYQLLEEASEDGLTVSELRKRAKAKGNKSKGGQMVTMSFDASKELNDRITETSQENLALYKALKGLTEALSNEWAYIQQAAQERLSPALTGAQSVLDSLPGYEE